MVTLEWVASPINDMYADAVLSAVLQADSIDTPKYIPSSAKVDKIHFKECLIEMLQGWVWVPLRMRKDKCVTPHCH